jgi:pimeloyl-ACP methyl ester carboxylesterase
MTTAHDTPTVQTTPTRTAVSGGGGVGLQVQEWGTRAGPPIVFIHGWSQSMGVWTHQARSPLLQRFRLVALDLRGHGDSEKPNDAYGDSQLWADDVAAVIDALGLERPLLVGWSYGGLVVNDYVRRHGDARLAGINYVGAATDFGVQTAYRSVGEAWNGLLPAGDGSPSGTVFAESAEEAASAMRSFLRRVPARPLPANDEAFLLGCNLLCPPRVRHQLFARAVENDDVLARIRVPVLVSSGTADEVIHPDTARHIAAHVPASRLSLYEGCGHAPFWEDADRFNRELADFADGT